MTKTKRPYTFIGCSKEGIEYAKAIQQNLEYIAETHIWHQGLFGLSDGTLENLVKSLDKFDFGILVIKIQFSTFNKVYRLRQFCASKFRTSLS